MFQEYQGVFQIIWQSLQEQIGHRTTASMSLQYCRQESAIFF